MRDYFSILPCKVQLQIEYINKRRVQSTRIVDVQSFVANSPDGMMVGFCHTRKMARSFSYSGITSATDTQSGEIIEPARLFLYLLAAHNSTPDLPALTDAHLKAYQPPQARRPAELHERENGNTTAFCFTGFTAAKKSTLAGKATAAGFKVYRDFNQNLTYLVCGDKAGKSKLDKAQAAGIEIINEPDFLDLMSNYNGA